MQSEVQLCHSQALDSELCRIGVGVQCINLMLMLSLMRMHLTMKVDESQTVSKLPVRILSQATSNPLFTPEVKPPYKSRLLDSFNDLPLRLAWSSRLFTVYLLYCHMVHSDSLHYLAASQDESFILPV